MKKIILTSIVLLIATLCFAVLPTKFINGYLYIWDPHVRGFDNTSGGWVNYSTSTPSINLFSQLIDSATVVVPFSNTANNLSKTNYNISVTTASNFTGNISTNQVTGYMHVNSYSQLIDSLTVTVPNSQNLGSNTSSFYLSTGTASSAYLNISSGAVVDSIVNSYNQLRIDTSTLYGIIPSTWVAQIMAGSNINLSPIDGHGNVTVGATIPWIGYATSTLNMNGYGIITSSYVAISTNSTAGYIQISDRYIIVAGTTSAAIQSAINVLGSYGGEIYIPSGVYEMSSLVTVKSSVTISGAGYGTIRSEEHTSELQSQR